MTEYEECRESERKQESASQLEYLELIIDGRHDSLRGSGNEAVPRCASLLD